MRMLLKALGAFVVLTSVAQAGDIVGYVGEFSALRDSKHEAWMGGLEYRFKDQFNGLRPTVGGFVAGDGETYGYGGAYWDLPLNTAPFVISPGFAVGAYGDNGAKDLGYTLEFRSTLEVTYKAPDGQRIGAQISHLSNANIGSTNPGTETVQVVYSHPF